MVSFAMAGIMRSRGLWTIDSVRRSLPFEDSEQSFSHGRQDSIKKKREDIGCSANKETVLRPVRVPECKYGAQPRERGPDVYAMSSAQEFANAVSMFAPTLALVQSVSEEPHALVVVLLIGAAMHLPVSFTYHLSCALQHCPDRIDNDLRRLDQTLQIVSGSLFAVALSGSWLYGVLHLFVHFRGICTMWLAHTSNDGMRWKQIALSVVFSAAPMQWRGDMENFIKALACMAVGGFCFVPRTNHRFFGGWGHSVFHLLLFLYARTLADSARKIPL